MTRLTLLLAGDTNIQERERPADAFSGVMPLLQEADLRFCHLEGLLSPPSEDPLHPDIPHKDEWHHAHPRMVEALAQAGIDGVSCASNVAYGREAVLCSVQTLDAAGIAHCGVGCNTGAARAPVILKKEGVRIGFLSRTSVFWPVGQAAEAHAPGAATLRATTLYQPHPRVLEMPGAPAIVKTVPNPGDLRALEEDIARLRPQVDVLIISCHWGVSSSEEVTDYQREVGRRALDAGADLVFGHHPHVIQGVEVWKDKPIFYSLGNFAFDWHKMRGRHLEGIVLQCAIEGGKLREVLCVPVQRDGNNTVQRVSVESDDGKAVLDRVTHLSEPFGTVLNKHERGIKLQLAVEELKA